MNLSEITCLEAERSNGYKDYIINEVNTMCPYPSVRNTEEVEGLTLSTLIAQTHVLSSLQADNFQASEAES